MKRVKPIDHYRHSAASTQKADSAPGDYYVSARDGGRFALLLGPFPTHQQALDLVDRASAEAEHVDPRAVWYGFGTCRYTVKPGEKPPQGKLNDRFADLDFLHEERK